MSQPFVSSLRPRPTDNVISSDKRKGKDGKARPASQPPKPKSEALDLLDRARGSRQGERADLHNNVMEVQERVRGGSASYALRKLRGSRGAEGALRAAAPGDAAGRGQEEETEEGEGLCGDARRTEDVHEGHRSEDGDFSAHRARRSPDRRHARGRARGGGNHGPLGPKPRSCSLVSRFLAPGCPRKLAEEEALPVVWPGFERRLDQAAVRGDGAGADACREGSRP